MAAYVFIDVSHKQTFIYKHNQLKYNLYNSFIIRSVTEEVPFLPSDLKHLEVSLSGYLEENFEGSFAFIYSGGGNSIIKFHEADQAKAFIRGYSREVLKAYPDLELYISWVDEKEVDGFSENEKGREIRKRLHQRADELKDKRRARFKRWTYGVEQIDETGQAVRSDKTSRDYNLPRKYLYQRFDEEMEGTTEELQEYKKDEDGKSYIGVIVVDGNKMGDMVNRITSLDQLGRFSEAIESLYHEAVITALKSCEQSAVRKDNEKKLCVTPVLMAGDDICLIMEAEYAIETAAAILKQIETLSGDEKYRTIFKEVTAEDESALKACAGVAIAKYNYPFFEAIKTAERLCHQAKEYLHRVGAKGSPTNASFIDWEIVQGPVSAADEYEKNVKHGGYKEVFHIKPLRTDQSVPVENGIYSYDAFFQMAKRLLEAIEKGKISHSTLEQLKKVTYSGWEEYTLFFDTKQTEDCRHLIQLVQQVFKDEKMENTAIITERSAQAPVYTYVLNDVLDALPFVSGYEEEKAGVER